MYSGHQRKHYSLLRRRFQSKVSARKLAAKLHKPLLQSEGLQAEQFSTYEMECITKWDLGIGSQGTYNLVKTSKKFPQDESLYISLLPHLQRELWKTQSKINKLEDDKFESKEKIDRFIENLKKKLSNERMKRRAIKTKNSRLKKKVMDMKSSVKYERRDRDAIEKVCEEMTMRMIAIKTKTKRMWDEIEEERWRLKMAKLMSEERVRFRLNDVKLVLQEKYEEMNWLVEDLEMCLKIVRSFGIDEMMKLRRSEDLIAKVQYMKIVDEIDLESFKFV